MIRWGTVAERQERARARQKRYRDTHGDVLNRRRREARAAANPDGRKTSLEATFWRHVTKRDEGCWEWRGARSQFSQGYGHMRFEDRDYVGSRVSWEIHNGPIPDGLLVLHDCDNKICCNPAHLHLGTHADNMREAVERGLLPGRRDAA